MRNLLGIHWIPTHRSSDDAARIAAQRPAYVKIVTIDEEIPYTEDVPASAKIIVRNHPMSELYGARATMTVDAPLGDRYTEYFTRFENYRQGRIARKLEVRGGGFTSPEQARALGEQHADVCKRMADRAAAKGVPKERLIFELLNEPHLWSNEPPTLVAEYTIAALRRGHSFGLWFETGMFGVGWPGNGGVQDAPVNWDFWQPVDFWMGEGDAIGSHEYWWLGGYRENWRWWAGRFLQCPYRKPWIISECGMDSGVTGTWYGGWHDLDGSYEDKARAYLGDNHLGGYIEECRKDGRVLCVTPFTRDYGSNHWEKFNTRNEAFEREAIAYVERITAMPEPGQPDPIPDPQPIPVPAPNIRAQVLKKAWELAGIKRNPNAAFFKAARFKELGVPMYDEYEVNGHVMQPFVNGILYCRKDDWGNIEYMDWYDSGVMRLVHPISVESLRRITQRWGEHPEWYSKYTVGGVALKGHNGIDYGLPTGSEIVACDVGTVAERWNDVDGYGLYIKLRHSWGESLYAHLSAQIVSAGDTVVAGQPVGKSGNTGNSTGPHLHFSIRINPYVRGDGWGGFTDPLPYLE